MTILEMLKSDDYTIYIPAGNRWLWYDTKNNEWVVYCKKYRAKKSIEIIRIDSEEIAVKYLLEE